MENKIQRTYNFLTELYTENTVSGITKYIGKHNVSTGIMSLMIEYGLIARIGVGKYVWIGDKPTKEMAVQIANPRYRAGFKEEEEIKTLAKPETIDKYYEALIDLYDAIKSSPRVSIGYFCENKKLSKNLSSVLNTFRIITPINNKKGSWEWIGEKPTRNMAIRVVQELGRRTNLWRDEVPKMDFNKKNIEPELEFERVNEEAKKEVTIKDSSNTVAWGKYFEIKLLWGLITLKATPIY